MPPLSAARDVFRRLLAVALALVGLAAFSFGSPPRELEKRAPSADAPQQQYFAWTSQGGLGYAWRLPRDYKPERPVHLTLICHGTGLDHRWGPANHPAKVFRPNDIVVSVDGPTPADKSRLFMGEPDDAKAIHAFLEEMRSLFAVDSVFLYGHSQGGFFVVYYAGEYPGDVAGVVAHASGSWAQSKTGKAVQKVAICFLHGTADPVVAYSQSPGSRDHYVECGFPLVQLRRLQLYNHWPNAVRVNEELDGCEGLTTSSAAVALACAERILEPKPADEYQWTTTVGYATARKVLRRIAGDGHAPFADVDAKTKARAGELIDAVEAEGAKHVAALRASLAKNKSLALDGGPWLGHLVAVREDFRGVDSVEAFVAEIGFDKLQSKQTTAARKVFDTWYGSDAPSKKYEALVEDLPGCYLCEGLPSELGKQLAEWRKDEKKLGASKKTSKGYDAIERWSEGWSKGREEYERIWKKWKTP